MEVDFVVQGNRRVLPTEVKAEENVQAKSLKTFIHSEFPEYHLHAVRLSMKPYFEQDWMTNIPLYATQAFFEHEGLGTDDE